MAKKRKKTRKEKKVDVLYFAKKMKEFTNADHVFFFDEGHEIVLSKNGRKIIIRAPKEGSHDKTYYFYYLPNRGEMKKLELPSNHLTYREFLHLKSLAEAIKRNDKKKIDLLLKGGKSSITGKGVKSIFETLKDLERKRKELSL